MRTHLQTTKFERQFDEKIMEGKQNDVDCPISKYLIMVLITIHNTCDFNILPTFY